ncbi:hypothetical protein BCR39DRAFT_559591 [Naematelia encephala]|uniref:Uncharacterized protein n=1 Tax=Naematelia encephala TaxID=71784 RepID=A0A1Y2B0F9_9TREE|nr:hypothetical protein BCR39DRAFT_559591 [Naematelia encephala]
MAGTAGTNRHEGPVGFYTKYQPEQVIEAFEHPPEELLTACMEVWRDGRWREEFPETVDERIKLWLEEEANVNKFPSPEDTRSIASSTTAHYHGVFEDVKIEYTIHVLADFISMVTLWKADQGSVRESSESQSENPSHSQSDNHSKDPYEDGVSFFAPHDHRALDYVFRNASADLVQSAKNMLLKGKRSPDANNPPRPFGGSNTSAKLSELSAERNADR